MDRQPLINTEITSTHINVDVEKSDSENEVLTENGESASTNALPPGSMTSTTKNSQNSKNNENGDYINEILNCYRQLFKRYQYKKEINTIAASYFSKIEFLLFLFPNVLIQCTMAILPVFLFDQPEQLKIAVSSLAAVSAAWISLGAKLQFGKKGERFKNLAKTYSEMCSDTYFKLTEEAFIEKKSVSFAKRRKNLMLFLTKSEKVEKLAKNGAPFMPEWILKKGQNLQCKTTMDDLLEIKGIAGSLDSQVKVSQAIQADGQGLNAPSIVTEEPYRAYMNGLNEDKERCSSTSSSCPVCLCGRPKTRIRAPNFDVF